MGAHQCQKCKMFWASMATAPGFEWINRFCPRCLSQMGKPFK